MKNIIILFAFMFSAQLLTAQDTISVQLFKKEQSWGAQTTNRAKAKFGKYIIKNENGSVTTTYYSFVKNKIESSSTFKGKEPTGFWVVTHYSGGKEVQVEKDYTFDLIYCEERVIAEDVYDGKKTKEVKESDNFIQAEPIGGMEAIFKVMRSVDYPQLAIDNDIEGKIYVKFIVNVDGSLSDFCVARGVNILLDKSALGQSFKLPNYIPATLDGVKVKSTVVVPVVFKLG